MKNSQFYIIGTILIILILAIPTCFAADNNTGTNTTSTTTNQINNPVVNVITNTNNINQSTNNVTPINNINTNTNNITIQNITPTSNNNSVIVLNPQNCGNISYAITGDANSENYYTAGAILDQNSNNIQSSSQSNNVHAQINLSTTKIINQIFNNYKTNPIVYNSLTQTIAYYMDTSLNVNLNSGKNGYNFEIKGKTILNNKINLSLFLSSGINLLKTNGNIYGHYTLKTNTKYISNQNSSQIENSIINGLFGNSQNFTTLFQSNKQTGKSVSLTTSNDFNNQSNNVHGTYKL